MLSPNTFEQDVNNTLYPFLETRKKLRETLLIDRILDNGKLIFEGTFDGYGDSGEYYIDTGNTDVDSFLNECLNINVTFDWYNNDGGGGDIKWEVISDKITINGYYNVTEQHIEMDEVEV